MNVEGDSSMKLLLVFSLMFSLFLTVSPVEARLDQFDQTHTGMTQQVGADGMPTSPPVGYEEVSATQAAEAATGAAQTAEAEAEEASANPKIKACASNAKNAKLTCSTLSAVTGLGGTEAAMLGMLINSQLPALITQLASQGKSAAEQCKIQADVNKVVTAITTLKAGACTAMMLSCKSSCAAVANGTDMDASAVKDAKLRLAACSKYTINIGLMAAQAGLGIINTLKGGQCSDALTASATATPISLTGSNVDCSNAAYASTNMVCICRNTPSDPMCAGLNGGPNYGGGAGGVAGSAVTPGLNKGEGEDGTEVGAAPKFEGTNGSNGMNASGGGGGLPGGSGGGGGLGGADGEGGAGAGFDKNVITGTAGGGGGMPGLSAVGGGGGGKGGGSGGGAGGGSGFDFKKYLPKGLFKNRGLAGMTVPSTDGITGPMGPSLWEKVTNRYQEKKSSLIQDK